MRRGGKTIPTRLPPRSGCGWCSAHSRAPSSALFGGSNKMRPRVRGSISVYEPTLSETPSTKPQAPEKFRNRNTKNQAPNTKGIPSSRLQTAALASSLEVGASLEFGAWCLGPGASLELGIGNLELVAWALGFS